MEQKVERSVALLKSLGSEQKRWEESSLKFKEQMSSIVGDVLLSSAFLAYAGYYDQLLRQLLLDAWSLHLHSSNIVHRDQLALTEVIQYCAFLPLNILVRSYSRSSVQHVYSCSGGSRVS